MAEGSLLFNQENAFNSKVDTIIKIEVGTVYYWPQLGSQASFFIVDSRNYSLDMFTDYLQQTLIQQNIEVTNITSTEQGFTLFIALEGSIATGNTATQTFTSIIQQRAGIT